MSRLEVNSYISIWQIKIWFANLFLDLLDEFPGYIATGNTRINWEILL